MVIHKGGQGLQRILEVHMINSVVLDCFRWPVPSSHCQSFAVEEERRDTSSFSLQMLVEVPRDYIK